MNSDNKSFIVLLLFIFGLAILCIYYDQKADRNAVEIRHLKDTNTIEEQKIMEYGYVIGQIAALKKAVVVAKDTTTGYWEWTGTPNKHGKAPIFNTHDLGKDF